VIASEIAEDLRSVLAQMEEMLGDLEVSGEQPEPNALVVAVQNRKRIRWPGP